MKKAIFSVLLLAAICAGVNAQSVRVTYPLWQNSTITGATNDTVIVTGFNIPINIWQLPLPYTDMAQVPDSIRFSYAGIGSTTATDSISVYFYIASAMRMGLYSTFSTIDSIKVQTATGYHTLSRAVFEGMWTLKVCRKGTSTTTTKNAYNGATLKEANLALYFHR